jgi:hypothetical protein
MLHGGYKIEAIWMNDHIYLASLYLKSGVWLPHPDERIHILYFHAVAFYKVVFHEDYTSTKYHTSSSVFSGIFIFQNFLILSNDISCCINSQYMELLRTYHSNFFSIVSLLWRTMLYRAKYCLYRVVVPNHIYPHFFWNLGVNVSKNGPGGEKWSQLTNTGTNIEIPNLNDPNGKKCFFVSIGPAQNVSP